jgi:glutamate-1-semialdehyde 2,1-aminomutase
MVNAYDVQESAKIVVEQYVARTSKSAALHLGAQQYLPAGDTRSSTCYPPHPTYIASGRGCWLTDVDGNEYIDVLNNYTSMVHGHAHPEIMRAVAEQLTRGTCYASPTEDQIELARAMCSRVPSVDSLRFCNSGTEATMNAIRAAKAFTGRNKLIKMEGGYHGTHDAAQVSVSPKPEEWGPADRPHSVPSSRGLFRGLMSDVIIAPANDSDSTAAIIADNSDDLAAVIIEPVMSAAGVIPTQPEYLKFLREVTERCGALLIFDEVVTFRLDHGGAQAIYAIQPDLTAFGKLIGGGFPVGAFGGRADIMALFDPRALKLPHGGTYNGNNITMAAGRAALSLLTSDEIARINSLGDRLRNGIAATLSRAGIAAQITGIGSVFGLHFTRKPITNYRDGLAANRNPMPLLHLALMNRGIFMAPRAFMAISTAMGTTEVDTVVERFTEAVEELQSTGLAFA